MNAPVLRRLVLASGNPGKLREFQALLEPLRIELIPQVQLGVESADEPHSTFIENALAKARHASLLSGLPALADDSGICCEALGGAPGVHSARYANAASDEPALTAARIDLCNNAKLLEELAPHADKRAYYVCVLVLLASPTDPRPIVADAVWHGEIIATPRGHGGFGYDPHFYLRDLDCTAAELSVAKKNRISHRALAMQSLLRRLTEGSVAPANG